MSYILDALRKSESERRQGKVPELGHQVQLIHKPRKAPVSALTWVGLALLLNAVVLAYVFWPEDRSLVGSPEPMASDPPVEERVVPSSGQAAKQARETDNESKPLAADAAGASQPEEADAVSTEPVREQQSLAADVQPSPEAQQQAEKPTIIVPSSRQAERYDITPSASDPSTYPHLVEMPLAYQKSIPDLVFNSHIYASDPSSRRVMINGHYLRAGQSFSGIRVEQITEEGVVLSKDGQRFRVGSVRNWMSPD